MNKLVEKRTLGQRRKRCIRKNREQRGKNRKREKDNKEQNAENKEQ